MIYKLVSGPDIAVCCYIAYGLPMAWATIGNVSIRNRLN